MKLVILGSGTCVPSIDRGAPANFLQIGDIRALIDCGPGTLRQLVKANLDYRDIDMVFVSHFHVDHISDLGPLIQALNWTPGFDRKKDLILIGPAGFETFYKRYIKPVCGNPRADTYKIIIKEITDSLEFPGFEAACFNTPHSPESVAFRLRSATAPYDVTKRYSSQTRLRQETRSSSDSSVDRDKSLVISGDCDYDEGMAEFSKNSDVLLLECSFENSKKMKGHMVSQECGKIAKKANAGKLILTHLYPPFSGAKRLAEAREIFPNTILAEDLLEIEI